MKTTTFGLVALAAVVNASLPLFPSAGEPDSVCKAKPYNAFASLMLLPAATSYCHKHFPLVTPTCLSTKTVVHTEHKTITKTKTDNEATTTTIVTGRPHTTNTIHTVTLRDSTSFTTKTLPFTITTCRPTKKVSTTLRSSTKTFSTTKHSGITKRANHDTHSDKLRQNDLLSLSSALASVTSMGKKSLATTICHCIQANPACTQVIKTKSSTTTKTLIKTKTIVKHPIVTKKVPNIHIHTDTVYKPRFTHIETITPIKLTGVCGATSVTTSTSEKVSSSSSSIKTSSSSSSTSSQTFSTISFTNSTTISTPKTSSATSSTVTLI